VIEPATHTAWIARPALRADRLGPETWSGFAAVRIDGAVNLAEDRRFRDLPVGERFERAVQDQRDFLNRLLDPRLDAVFDLRLTRDPADDGLRCALLVRALADDPDDARRRVADLLRIAADGLPDHVLAAIVTDEQELIGILRPFGDREIVDAAFLTRDEITATPQRADILREISYYYSVPPLGHGASDWSGLYAQLRASSTPVVVSVALMPLATSSHLVDTLELFATRLGQWAGASTLGPTLLSGDRHVPGEAFAADAAPAFAGYAQRLARRAFGMRILLASPEPLSPALASSLGATVSPLDPSVATASAGYQLRTGDDAGQIAAWDLGVVDVCVPGGRPEVWSRVDPPPDVLADLPVLVDAQDAACGFRLPIAATGDLPGIRVRRGRFGQSEASTGGRRPVRIGRLADGDGELFIDADSLVRHALIAGSTGSGKTTLILELLRQLWVREDGTEPVPFMVIEPVNAEADDYRRLAASPGLEDLEVYTVGDERHRPLRFNPLAVPPGVVVAEHMAAVRDCFDAAFGLWGPLPAIYEDAIADAYLGRGILPNEIARTGDDDRWPTVVHLLTAMKTVFDRHGYTGDVRSNLEAASVLRVRRLVHGTSASVFRTDRRLAVEHLLERPVIIELKALGSGDEQALVMALLLTSMTQHYKATRGASDGLQHVTVLEEAHRLLARAKGAAGGTANGQAKEQAAESFANVLAENRKYGEGIVIAEQIPSRLVEDAVKNTNLKIMCRLPSEEERQVLGTSMAMSEQQLAAAARLTVGQALVASDELANATEVRTDRTIVGAIPDVPAFGGDPPLAACERHCPAPCRWRDAGLAISARPSVTHAVDAALKVLHTASPDDDRRRGEQPILLVRALVEETRRYPALGNPDERLGAAICAAVHATEGQTTSDHLLAGTVQGIEYTRRPRRP
jgi:hypothetical protein